ncbi:DinB family protein [uncultured Imperialibacter sp.]|uniref:DinB family protein n=1 Tax=uncultured Imperialibacter sp. TaxID=1672639 RepID=UPI0030D72B71|tara:strand:- start:61527 stop:62069 length:543 start_codon:yes stop_codon:yes gene_type:complete
MSQYLVSQVLDQRPAYDEYPAFYHKYVDALPSGNLLHILENQLHTFSFMLERIEKDQWDYRYAEGKWSVKEVLGHIIDAERVFAFRAATFARGDKNELPGFDENAFVEESDLVEVSPESLLLQFSHLRKSNILLYASFTREAISRTGVSNGKSISVAAIVFITAGHLQHHMNILKERYGL